MERLLAQDPSKAPHNYFLGLSLVREGIRIPEAISYLEKAADLYAMTDVDPGMGEPELVHYYLVMAHARLRQCDKALKRYYELVEVYSQGDPFYTKEAVKWVELCNEPERMAQEAAAANSVSAPISTVRDRLVPLTGLATSRDSVVTRPTEYTTQSVLYGVQVGALVKATYTMNFPGLRNVGVYSDENGIYRYVIGNLPFRSQAEKLLQEVKQAGYPDAFIVDINNPGRYGQEVVLLNHVGIQRQLKGDVEFRVQIGAFAEYLPERLLHLYLALDGLKEERSNELTLLTIGSFRDYDSAQMERERMVGLGFADAFVTAFNQGQRVPIDLALRHLENSARPATPEAEKRRVRK